MTTATQAPETIRPESRANRKLPVLAGICGALLTGAWLWLKPAHTYAFEAITITGERITVPAEGLSWVNFWSPGCPPCLKEMPLLDNLNHAYGDRVKFVAVSAPYDPPNIIKEIHEKFALTLPLAMDLDGRIANRFASDMLIPSHYLIDEKGHILLSLRGELTESTIRSALSKHL